MKPKSVKPKSVKPKSVKPKSVKPKSVKQVETLLGFDFGLKFIGVAVGQTVSATASPLRILASDKGVPWSAITALLHTWHPARLVVGVPLNMDGTEQKMTQCARRFMRRLGGRSGLPVHGVDERLTTVEARDRAAARRGRVDAIAAQVILESWLNAQRTSHPDADSIPK